MSCWVVPSIAAEIWQMPLDDVLRRIRSGEIPSQIEEGFLVVDVAPNSPRLAPPRRPPELRPPTFTAITREEIEALTGDLTEDEEPPLEEEGWDRFADGWKAARLRTSRTRRGPQRRIAAYSPANHSDFTNGNSTTIPWRIAPSVGM